MAALTAKQEAFARAVATGMNQSDAYRAAYDVARMKATSINVNACKLMADAKVAQRVAELRRPAIEKVQYSVEQAMLEAADALQVAKASGNGGAMVAVVTLRSGLHGLLIECREVCTGPLEALSTDELEAMDAAIDAIQRARGADATRA